MRRSSGDGDDVLRRFRFQMEFAALQAIALLRDGTIAHCIYCEQVEDILVELNNGRFIGKQVKTRELTQDPLKASDDAIEAALAAFLSKRHPVFRMLRELSTRHQRLLLQWRRR